MASLSQEKRTGSFQTLLGKDKLVLASFEGHEGLSELFEFRVNCLSEEKGQINFDRLLGTDSHVTLATKHEGVDRHFHGVITEAQFRNYTGVLTEYQVVLRPWLWLLTRTRNSRIFNDKSVTEIIKEVFGNYSYAHFEIRMPDTFPKLEYCVQYRESDFNFVSRLMEDYLIFYHFEHSEDQHLMVLTIGSNDNKPKDGGMDIVFDSTEQNDTRKEDFIRDFQPARSFYTNKFVLNDFDYKKPKADLLAEAENYPEFDKRNLEFYNYPGGYTDKGQGIQLATDKAIQEQRRDYTVFALGDALTCCPGKVMKLKQHVEESFNVQYLVRRAHHVFKSNQYQSVAGDQDQKYHGRYELIWNLTEFQPPSVTPKPIIPGPQTAFVETEMDNQTRLKVKFHWERGKELSRYVRISHAWSGSGWGDFKIPRIGMEVIVEFLNGDPDYPLITGCVYNGDYKPPYKDAAISGTKSQSIGGTGNSTGYNEFIFKDTGGSELVRLHAEKDMEGTIKNNETRTIGHNSSLKVGNSVDVAIGNSRTEMIGMDWTVSSIKSITFVCGASTIAMTPASIAITSPNISLTAAAAINVIAGASITETAGGAFSITAGAAVAITAGGPAVMHGTPTIAA
jgi:type VI secretion system secreted protein VgrG